MDRKCEKCGADMVELFSSSVCSNDCKGDTPLETPEGYDTHAANIAGNPKYPDKCVQGDELMPSQKHNRSGSYPVPTEEEIQQQKKKMLKALINYNTIADEYTHLDKTVCYACKLKKLEFIATGILNYVKVECKNCGIAGPARSTCQEAYEVWKQAWKPWREFCDNSISNEKKFGDLIAKDFGDPLLSDPFPAQPIQTVKLDHIDPSIKEFEKEMIKALGIPSHIISGVKDNYEKVRGQRATQICMMDEYCNLDTSIFDNVISSLKDGNFDVEKKKLKIRIEKLSPENGDLLIFKMPPLSSDEDYHNMAKRLDELELDAQSIVIPDSITVEHVPLNRDKDNDLSEE